MKAALLIEPGKVEIQETDRPEPGPGEVLVRIHSCGVCATDVKKYTGGSKAPHLPFILGHEPAGTIEVVGEGVSDNLSPGMRVLIAPVFTCGYCDGCLTGSTFSQGMGMCENYEVLGYSIDGAFAEYAVAPAKHIHPIPDTLSFRDAALVEPVAACLNGVQRGIPELPGSVAVLGAGFMGLASIQLYKLFGNRVFATDLLESRCDAARKNGADFVFNPKKDSVVENILRLTNGKGVDAVLCSVGSKNVTEEGLKMLAKGGTLVLLASAPGGTHFEVDLNKFHYDQSVITGSVSYTGRGYQWMIECLAEGRLDLDVLISHTGPLEDVEKFMSMTADLQGLKKVILL
jgi:L-iditol 2-dehydrogenase